MPLCRLSGAIFQPIPENHERQVWVDLSRPDFRPTRPFDSFDVEQCASYHQCLFFNLSQPILDHDNTILQKNGWNIGSIPFV